MTFFTFASDLGSTTSLLYFFHRTARDGGEFPLYFAAVRSPADGRSLAGAAAVMVALPRLPPRPKGYGSAEIALATAGVLLSVWFQISASLSVLALRLADRYTESYVAEIARRRHPAGQRRDPGLDRPPSLLACRPRQRPFHRHGGRPGVPTRRQGFGR